MISRRIRQAMAAAAILCMTGSAAHPKIVDGIVAVVNGEPITFSEFRESTAETLGIPEGDADIYLREEKDRSRILDRLESLVDEVLVRQELEKIGQPVTVRDVDRAVESVMRGSDMSEAAFRETLAREGVTPSAYRERIRWQMERGSIVRAKKLKEVTITEEEARTYFRETAERFLTGAEVRLETLFLPFPAEDAGAEATARVRIAAQHAAEYAESGMSLPEAAGLLSSEVPGVLAVSSEFLRMEDLIPEIAKEVRRLRTGETSQPVFSETGVYLVKVLERRGGTLPEYSDVKAAITEELVDRRSERAFEEILEELKKAATIDIHL